MTTENLKFKIQLYAQYWDKPPVAEILVGDQSRIKQEITGTEQNPNVFEFYQDLTEGQDYKFVINNVITIVIIDLLSNIIMNLYFLNISQML